MGAPTSRVRQPTDNWDPRGCHTCVTAATYSAFERETREPEEQTVASGMQTVARGAAVLAALLFCSLALLGCGSPEARLASHMQRGKSYLAQGNLQKAQVEFRNAMQIAPERVDARLMSGEVAERLGDVRDALGLYQSAIELDPASVSARVSLARLYVFAHAPTRALDTLRPALLQHPDDASLLAARAAARAELSDRTAALADAERAVHLAPDNDDAISILAALYQGDGKLEQAADLLQAAVGRRPAETDLRRILADLYVKQGNDALAEAQLAKIVALQPKDLRARYQLVSFYTRSRRLDDAERVLKGALTAFPDSDEAKLAYVNFLARQRSAPEGERALAGFIASNPTDYDLQLAQAALRQQQNQTEDAMAGYRSVIAHAGARPQAIVARDRLASMLVSQRRFDEASSLIAQVLETNAHDDDSLILRADIALERGKPAAAITDLRAVLHDRPLSAPILRTLARAYLADGQTSLAEESLRSAVDDAPKDGEGRVELAALLARTRRLDAAVSLLEQSVQALPRDETVREALVRTYMEKSDLADARKAAEDLASALPASWRGPYLEGIVAQAQNRSTEAESDFERALGLRPDAIEVLAALARLDIGRGQADKSITRLQSAIAKEPANAALHNLLGELYLRAKDVQSALREWTRCTQLAPDWWLPYHNQGAAQVAAGDVQTAIEIYQRGVAATHMQPLLVSDLAALYEDQGRVDDAIRLYEALHREFPGLVLASNNLAMLLATYKTDHASLERAQELSSGFADSSNADLLDTLGWVHLKCGEITAALQVLEEAAGRAPSSRVIQYHLGMAQLRAGQRDRARASLEAALSGSARFAGWEDARSALARLGS